MNSKKKTVRYAVVGMGYIAQVAVLPGFKNAKSNSVLTALVSGSREKRQALKKKYGAEVFSYEEYDSLLDSGSIDAVYIALPNDQHKDFAVRALKKGVHVLCEKPLAVTAEECDAIIRAADEGGAKLMVAYRLHFEKSNMEVVKIAQSGKLGDVRFFSSTFSINVKEGNYRLEAEQGGGSVYDLGIYCINASRYIFRAEPTEVTAVSANNGAPRFKGIDEMTSVTLRFPGDRLAQFVTSFGTAATSAYDLVGTKGSLRMDQAYEYVEKRTMTLIIGEKKKTITFPAVDQFAAELLAFSDCVLKDRQPEASGQEGLIDVRIIEAIYESARTGRPVKLDAARKKTRPSASQVIQKPAIKKPDLVGAESPSQ